MTPPLFTIIRKFVPKSVGCSHEFGYIPTREIGWTRKSRTFVTEVSALYSNRWITVQLKSFGVGGGTRTHNQGIMIPWHHHCATPTLELEIALAAMCSVLRGRRFTSQPFQHTWKVACIHTDGIDNLQLNEESGTHWKQYASPKNLFMQCKAWNYISSWNFGAGGRTRIFVAVLTMDVPYFSATPAM